MKEIWMKKGSTIYKVKVPKSKNNDSVVLTIGEPCTRKGECFIQTESI